MMHFRNRFSATAASSLAVLGVAASAQAATNLKILNFETNVGSFKAMGTDHPAHGLLTFSFTGTVLVSGLDGSVKVEGNVRKEYENIPHKKQVYHGTGKMTVNGTFTGVQFFGQKLTGRFEGVAIFRLYGEFDKNLSTGLYWYEGGDKKDWGTGGDTLPVPGYRPNQFQNALPIPTVKVKN